MSAWLEANSLALWTIAVAILCNVPCAILGCYLVLRRMSLLGDAISHGVLPGLAITFLLTGSVSSGWMVVGAVVLGMMTAFLTHGIHELADVPEDSSMGVVFTSLFAIGVILIRRNADQAHIDTDCVLYGLIEMTPLDTFGDDLWGFEVPRAVQTLGPALLATVGFVLLFWKELKLVSFDPALASAMGFRVGLIHYLLMAMVASVTVTSFESVGSILVIAMLIVPAAAAQMLTDRLSGMIAWAVAVAVASAVLGYLGAAWLNTSVAGMMAVAAGGLFGLAVFLAPRHGLMMRSLRRLGLSLRIAREDILATLFRAEESHGLGSAGRGWMVRIAAAQLRHSGKIVQAESGWRLTGAGRSEGRELVRAHRLWETYLNTQLDLPPDHVHAAADRMEHFTDPALSAQIASELANPGIDPHGRPIPVSEGRIAKGGGQGEPAV